MRSLSRVLVINYSEGLRPSDSPTRALARRFDGSLRSRGSLARSFAATSAGLRPSPSPTPSLAAPHSPHSARVCALARPFAGTSGDSTLAWSWMCSHQVLLSDSDVLEIIPGLDPLRLAEGSVVEVHPGGMRQSVRKRHADLRAHVQTMVSIARSVAFDFVQGGKNGCGIRNLVKLAPDGAVGRRDRGRIEAQIEQ